MEWKHSLTVGQAAWIVNNDIVKMHLNDGKVVFTTHKGSTAEFEFIHFYLKELVIEPSVQSMVRLSNEVAQSLFNWMDAI